MEKLNLKNIKIKSPGKQIKEAILDEFESIDEFAELVDLYPSSLKRYLRSNKVPNAFKVKVVNELSKGYDEIVLSETEQLRSFVEDIFDNIDLYKDENDIIILEKLKDLCLKRNMAFEVAKMNRNISMYYYKKEDMNFAIEYMRLAISGIENDNSFLVSCMSLLGLMYFYRHNYSKAKEVLEEAEAFLPRIKNKKILFYYYYRKGILYSCMYEEEPKQLELAKDMFIKALNFAKEEYALGFTIMNIGIVYKKKNTFEKAIRYYNKALESFKDDFNKSIVYNNLAEIYKVSGDYEKGLYYINQAFKYLGNKSIAKSFLYYQTYVQIKMFKGESKEIIEKLKELLANIDDFFIYREIIIKGINTIIDYGKVYENTDVFEALDDLIMKLRKDSDGEYDKELKACSWDIRTILDNINNGRRRLGI